MKRYEYEAEIYTVYESEGRAAKGCLLTIEKTCGYVDASSEDAARNKLKKRQLRNIKIISESKCKEGK